MQVTELFDSPFLLEMNLTSAFVQYAEIVRRIAKSVLNFPFMDEIFAKIIKKYTHLKDLYTIVHA